jgi:hypothetical protein
MKYAIIKDRLKIILSVTGFILVPIVPFYTAFVIQTLWNWFVVNGLHAAEISYWESFGILLVVAVFTHRGEHGVYQQETRSNHSYLMIEALLPDEKRLEFQKSFQEEDDSWKGTLGTIGPQLGKAILNTLTLVIGWGVHTFFM